MDGIEREEAPEKNAHVVDLLVQGSSGPRLNNEPLLLNPGDRYVQNPEEARERVPKPNGMRRRPLFGAWKFS